MGPAYFHKASAKLLFFFEFTNFIINFVSFYIKKYIVMKNSSLLIGLGVGLLVGAAIGLYFATSDEDKTKFLDELKSKADEAKKSIGDIVKQGMEELDKVVGVVGKTAKEKVSNIEAQPESF